MRNVGYKLGAHTLAFHFFIHRVLHTRAQGEVNGLSQYLSGQKNREDIIYETNYEGFSVICAGPYSPNPAELLEEGKNLVFLTLGDPTVYSTGIYIYQRLKKMGYQGEIFSGIPSFCAVAARLEIPLAENRQELHVLPASYGIEEKLKLPGTKVLMKTGKQMAQVKAVLKEEGQQAKMVMNCGLDGEKIYKCTEEIPEDAGYFSIVIAKEKEK